MLAANVGHRIAQIVIVLCNVYPLPVSTHIEIRGTCPERAIGKTCHHDIRIGIVEGRHRRNAEAGERDGAGNALGAGWRVCKTYAWIILTELAGQTVETNDRLIQKMIVEGIGVS